jgi:hypothetical protein
LLTFITVTNDKQLDQLKNKKLKVRDVKKTIQMCHR